MVSMKTAWFWNMTQCNGGILYLLLQRINVTFLPKLCYEANKLQGVKSQNALNFRKICDQISTRQERYVIYRDNSTQYNTVTQHTDKIIIKLSDMLPTPEPFPA